MSIITTSDAAKAVVRRNTAEVQGPFLGMAPNYRKIHFETVDVMRVHNGKITDHWGVGNLLSLMEQIGGWTPPAET